LAPYQAGVCQALHEAGIEPDWIIGTSIGAIKPDRRQRAGTPAGDTECSVGNVVTDIARQEITSLLSQLQVVLRSRKIFRLMSAALL
jgi:hypothetical protein